MIIKDNKHELLLPKGELPRPLYERFAVVRGALARLESTILPLIESSDGVVGASSLVPSKAEGDQITSGLTLVSNKTDTTPSITEGHNTTAEEQARQLVNEAFADVA